MLYLKKYLTEGLVQAALLLSLCGVQVQVGLDSHLPPSLHQLLLSQASALSPAPPHHLQRRHGLHPKSVDLDGLLTARRLLGWVRSLDRLQVPHAEVETWLVQREPGPIPAGRSDQPSPLERPAAAISRNQTPLLLQLQTPAASWEAEEEEEEEEEYVVHLNVPVVDRGDQDLNRRTSPEPGPGGPSEHINTGAESRTESDQTAVSLQECLRLLEETFPFTEEQELGGAGDRREELQGQSADQDPSLLPPEAPSVELELHWQDLLSIMEPENINIGMELQSDEGSRPQLLITEAPDGSLFLQLPPAQHGLVDPATAALLPLTPSAELDDHSLPPDAEASLQHLDLFHSPPDHTDLLEEEPSACSPFDMCLLAADAEQTMETPSHMDAGLHSHLPAPSSSGNGLNQDLPDSPPSGFLSEADGEEDDLALIDLLESGSMLEEMRLLDAALEEGLASQMEEEAYLDHELSYEEPGRTQDQDWVDAKNQDQPETLDEGTEDEADSDSGLSLDFSHSPASPCVSEASSYSYSSAASSFTCMPGSHFTDEENEEDEESSAGSDMELEVRIKQEELDEEEMGAVGGGSEHFFTFKPGNHKLLQDLPWMEQVGHDHTYNQPWSSVPPPPVVKRTGKHSRSAPGRDGAKPYRCSFSKSRMWSRDERRAQVLGIPFSNELIVNLPVEEFNELLMKYHLNEEQLNLIKDIRRRGKNKIAAQNCRKRKLDVLLGLEDDVSTLRRCRSRLLREKEEDLRNLQEMKQRLAALYQEVFSRLRDESGRPLNAAEHLLQFGPESTVTEAGLPPIGRKDGKKAKDKK